MWWYTEKRSERHCQLSFYRPMLAETEMDMEMKI